jgi:phospholipase/carboxylesterase
VISLQAPYKLGEESYAWYHVDFSSDKPVINTAEELNSRKQIVEFIEWSKKEFKIDAQRIFMCGFSQGSIMSYSVAISNPNLIKGIAIMSGRMLDEIQPALEKNDISKLRVFISHGTKDPMLKIEYARNAKLKLTSKHCKISYHEFDDVHTINESMYQNLVTWLSANLH